MQTDKGIGQDMMEIKVFAVSSIYKSHNNNQYNRKDTVRHIYQSSTSFKDILVEKLDNFSTVKDVQQEEHTHKALSKPLYRNCLNDSQSR